MSVKRTFGWIQNPGDLKKLKKVVSIMQMGSSIHNWLTKDRLPLLMKYRLISVDDYTTFQSALSRVDTGIEYRLMKGKGSGSSGRSNAICTGIVQAVIDAQSTRTYIDGDGVAVTMKKPYTDDWSADGYLRWAISCGLLEYVNETDTCKISLLGKELALTEDSSQREYEILTEVLLSYPPVIRILSLLKEKDGQTKFELGNKLGFIGELGFTSIPQEIFMYDYCTADTGTRKKIRSNFEGDSDKYSRGIASWLIQMDWAVASTKKVACSYQGAIYSANMQVYSITRKGERALAQANGNSRNPRHSRTVMFEMLASNRNFNAEYLRLQRAYIIQALSKSWKTLAQLQKMLQQYQLDVSISAITDHIVGLNAIGLNIVERDGSYKLLDKITRLNIPEQTSSDHNSIDIIKERVRNILKTVDHKYLVLIDLAYSNASATSKKLNDAREFEIQTAELFTKELKFSGMRLGDANRPDVIISYGENGTIIDNKAYKDGFSIDKRSADEMSRYINENRQRINGIPTNEWWKNFPTNVINFTFLFITSFLKGHFEEQLAYISAMHNGIKGATINVENLLYLAESLKTGKIPYDEFPNLFINQEIHTQ